MVKIEPVRIAAGIHYVGAVDAGLRVFDVIMNTPYGTTYNAYLVQGTEKSALVEVVKEAFGSGLLEALSSLMDVSTLDYIVVNHSEPDHSGALGQLLKEAPNAKVYCSKSASMFLGEIVNREVPVQAVSDGDKLELGGKTLEFYMAPMLHWPDTMFTYVREDNLLFTGDVFGCHYAIEESVWATDYPMHDVDSARKYYYDTIMSPFKSRVQRALDLVDELKPDVICPSHGPITRDEDAHHAVQMYRDWAAPEESDGKKHVFIGYVSAYGYTRALAMKMREAVESEGLVADTYDVSVDFERAVNAANRADVILLGSPTFNKDALAPVWRLTLQLSAFSVMGKPFGVFGSYGWSGEACAMLQERLRGLGMKPLGEALRVRFRPRQEDLDTAYAIGIQAAEAALGKQ